MQKKKKVWCKKHFEITSPNFHTLCDLLSMLQKYKKEFIIYSVPKPLAFSFNNHKKCKPLIMWYNLIPSWIYHKTFFSLAISTIF